MARVECPHESDVLTMVVTGQWPDRAPANLRAHVAACELCADLALVAQAIDLDHSVEIEPRLPGSGTMWWRARLRARQDAAKQVGRPITVAQAAFLALLGGAAGAVFGATTDWFQRGLEFTGAAVRNAAAAVRLPSLPSLPVPTDMATTLASYGPTLLIVGLGAAAATAIMVWALREG